MMTIASSIIVMTLFGGHLGQSTNTVTAQDLLAAFKRHVDLFTNFSVTIIPAIKGNTITRDKSGKDMPLKYIAYSRFSNFVMYNVINNSKDKIIENEYIFNGKYYLHLEYINEVLISNITGAFIEKDSGRNRQRMLADRSIAFLTLFFPPYSIDPLSDISKSELSVLTGESVERFAYKLVAKSDKGVYQIFFDNKLVPKRITRSVIDYYETDDKQRQVYDELYGKINKLTLDCKVMATVLNDGYEVPSRIMGVVTLDTQKRGLVSFQSESEFVNYDFGLKIDAKSFTPMRVVPNGTTVSVIDEPQFEYEWWNGEIVKKINKDTVAGLAQHEFKRGYLGYALLCILLLLLAIVIWYYIWKWRSTRSLKL